MSSSSMNPGTGPDPARPVSKSGPDPARPVSKSGPDPARPRAPACLVACDSGLLPHGCIFNIRVPHP